MAITSFEIVSVPVNNAQRTKLFYRDVLGFQLLREMPMAPGQVWIQLAPPGCSTSIALVSWFESMRAGGLQGVMLTDDVDAERATLLARGLALSEIKSEPWGRYALFNDPDGNGWVLRQPPGQP